MQRLVWLGCITVGILLVAVACRGAAPPPASPEPAGPPLEEVMRAFYQGKTVTVVVGYPPGGGYDLYARTLARHLGRHIPGNPDIIVQNMAGAGSLVAANHVYNVAAKDGTVVGTFAAGLLQDQLMGKPAVRFDGPKFTWVGSITEESYICFARADAPIKSLSALIGSPTPLLMGGTGPGANTDDVPRVLNAVLKTNFRLISGYPGGADVNLALARGEVQGRCNFWSSVKATNRDWLDQKFINILVLLAAQKHPELPDVPAVMELAKAEEDRRLLEVFLAPRLGIARPYAAPPGLPPERVAGLRKAFLDTMKDPGFKADLEKQRLELSNPTGGEEVQKLVEKIFASPPAVIERLKGALK